MQEPENICTDPWGGVIRLMKIRYNFLLFIIPDVLGVLLTLISFTELGGKDKDVQYGVTMLIVGLLILFLTYCYRTTNYLELKDGILTWTSGLKKQSSPVDKIQCCEYSGFWSFNKIRINLLSHDYEFKNMTNCERLAQLVNDQMRG